MPRPLRSPVREAFVAAVLVVLLMALPGAGSPLALLVEVLQIGVVVAIGAILASLELQRRARVANRPNARPLESRTGPPIAKGNAR